MTQSFDSPQTIARQQRCARRRPGVTVTELVAATSVVALISVLLVPVISGVARVREGATQHQLAVLEAANLMEQIAALRASGPLTRQQLDALALSSTIQDQLDDARLEISPGEAAGSPPAQSLAIEISWENEHGQRGVPVRVVTYLYDLEAPGDAQP